MDTYIPKKRIRLSFAGSDDHRYIRIDFGGDGVLRGCLAQEEEISFREGIAYIPADKFELSAFFDRHMVMAFIDYSAIKSAQEKPRSAAPTAPPLPPGILWENSNRMKESGCISEKFSIAEKIRYALKSKIQMEAYNKSGII